MLLAFTLRLLAPAAPPVDAPTVVLSPEPCGPAFNLVVPGELLREGVAVVVEQGDAGARLRFDLRPLSVTVTLRRDGQESAAAKAALPRLRSGSGVILKCRPDHIAVVADGRTLCRAPGEMPAESRWGLVGTDAVLLEQITCQPVADAVLTDDFMRGADETGAWTNLSGRWDVAALDAVEYSANAFLLNGRAEGGEPAVTVAGDWFWEDYTLEAAVRIPSEDARFGLGLYAEPGVGHHLLRFDGLRGKFGLVRDLRGRETILAETPGALRPGEWHRLSLSAVGRELSATVDGEVCLAATDESLAQGQALLWVGGEETVEFDDVAAYSGPRPARRPVTLAYAADVADPAGRRFADDHYMEGWADERDQWRAGPGPSVWHAGCFWGDAALTWEVDPSALAAGVELHLAVPLQGPSASPPTDPTAGYQLRLAEVNGQLALTLLRDAVVRAEATAPVPPEGGSIALRRTGGRIEALVGDQVAAAFEDETPSSGAKVGLTSLLAAGQPGRLRITAWNVLDSAFRAAPTEWRVVGGDWSVQSRWACTPRWSWFGGRSPDLAAIWTRDAYPGDVAVEFFAGFQMDTPYAPFYQHPSNIAVTLCGDGATPGSGYSFILGARGNRETLIFRRDEIVARTEALRLPDILDALGGGAVGQTGAIELHKEWEHLRAERIGGTVRLLVDGKAILEYADPDPLPGGAVGLWTLDNGLTVARARVYHQGAEPVRLPEAPLSEALPLPALPLELTGPDHVAGSLKHGLGGWSGAQGTCSASLAVREGGSNDRCLLVSNPRPGGPFALRAPVRDLDLLRHPLLAFDCAIPPSVCVDAYLTVKGGRFRLRLTGPDAAPIGTEELGGVPGLQADGRWQHVEVDLLARLRPFYPPNAPLVLNGLEFANHGALEYLQAGIGGNPLGACYRLDNLRVGKMPVARGTRGAEGAPVWREAPAAAASGDTPLRCDFEADAGGLRLWDIGGGAVPRRTHGRALANPQGGNWCLEVVNSDIGGMFGLEFGCRPFDAARYPTLDFDYCAPDTLRVDLLLEVGGSRRIVKFTDNDATWPVIGSVGAVADGRWHHASVDLHALLRQAFPSATALPVTRLGLASSGWPGNRRGTAYWLDNVELRPSAAGVLAEALVQSPQDALPPAPPPVEYRPADCAVQTGFEGIAADDPAMWGNFLGCQVVRCAEGGASGPGCLELRDLRDGNGSAFALIAQLPRDWREHPRLRFRYRTRRGSPASLTVRGTTYDGVTDQWTVLASLPAAGGAWQDADVDLAAALDAAAARLTMHRIFLDVSISDPDEALLIDDYALQRPTATENGDAVQ